MIQKLANGSCGCCVKGEWMDVRSVDEFVDDRNSLGCEWTTEFSRSLPITDRICPCHSGLGRSYTSQRKAIPVPGGVANDSSWEVRSCVSGLS